MKRAAEQGHVNARFALAERDADSRGIAEGVAWYSKAAEEGDSGAQLSLAECYEYGTGVGQDQDAALAWYRKAAKQGVPQAQYRLGLCYEKGTLGVDRDGKLAVDWYTKAADQGDSQGLFHLAECHDKGIGVSQDRMEAFAKYWKAAEQGCPDAQHKIGVFYAKGVEWLGALPKQLKAEEWLKKAAEQGHEEAELEMKKLKTREEVGAVGTD